MRGRFAYQIMIGVLLICLMTDVGQEEVQGCTIGVASGKATADGRPLLWRNRDGSGRNYEVVYFKNGRFKLLATAYPGSSQAVVGAGVNEFGFCIVSSASFDLQDKSGKVPGVKHILRLALQQCVTVDDFENILKQTNVSGRRTTGNIGVIDAFGGAAIFEIGSSFYTRFDATNPKVAPQGYVIRANFALTGGGDSGRARYDRANQLWQQAIEKGQLDYRYVLRKVCRDLSGAEEISYTRAKMDITENNALKVLNNQNAISRPGTTNVALFHGVKPDENPSLTTFWAILGGPIFSVAVPSWVIAESTAPEIDGEEFSPLCTAANDLYLANYVTGDKRRLLLNPEMLPDIWAVTYPAEDRIFDHTESIMAQWRQDYPTAQQVASFHRSMASEAMSALEEATELLVQKGGTSANLRVALYMKDLEKAKAFIKQGFNINVLDGYGYAPLHYAVQNNQKKIVQLLIAHGADINTKGNVGKTPLDIAMKEWCQDMVKLLVGKGAEVSTHVAAFIGDVDKVKDFIKHSGSVDTTDASGWTLLQRAAAGNHKDIAEFLIEKGADVNAKGNWDWTSLHFVAEAGHKEIVRLLITAGADINAKDGGGSTPLWYAQKEGHTEIVKLLRKRAVGDLPKVNATKSVRFNDVADLVITGEAGGRQQFGNRIFQGDVNGDGCEDLLVTASNYDKNRGRAYLYFGGPDMDANADKTFTGENAGDLFGEFAFLGELNNDDYDDVIVGALRYNSRQGRVYIFYGGPDMDENTDLTLEGEMTDTKFGQRITVGDVNNDGYKDLFVSAPQYQSYTGRVYLYYGGEIFDTTVDKTFMGEDTDDTFGFNLSVRGDVDGDGCNDLLIGTPYWPNNTKHGRAYLFYGAAGTEMDVIPDLIFDAENGRDNFAVGLDLFDIDDDGYADVLITARKWPSLGLQGRAYLYWGSSRATMDNVADKIFTGKAGVKSELGGNTIYVGHVNDDNYGDIYIAAYGYLNSDHRGRGYLYYGNTKASMDTVCDHTFTEGEVNSSYGKEAKLADLNGDSLDDAILGAYRYNNFQGRVHVYFNKPDSAKPLQ